MYMYVHILKMKNKIDLKRIHSREMNTKHIKFEILIDRLCLFNYNLKQLNVVLNLIIGQNCKENFHPFGDVSDDVTRAFDTCHRLAYGSIVSNLLRFDNVIEFTSGYKHFIYAAMKVKKCYLFFSDLLFRLNFDSTFGNIKFSIIFCQFKVNTSSNHFFSIDWLGLKQYRA